MLPQRLEEGMPRICPIPGGFQVILDGEKSLGLEGDAPEFFPLTDDINDCLIPVGLEILDLQAAYFGFSESCREESQENRVITLALQSSSIRYSENGLGFFLGEKFGLFLFHGSTSFRS